MDLYADPIKPAKDHQVLSEFVGKSLAPRLTAEVSHLKLKAAVWLVGYPPLRHRRDPVLSLFLGSWATSDPMNLDASYFGCLVAIDHHVVDMMAIVG